MSVLVTVFNNGGPLLQRAIDSVRGQTMPDWELVLWDDGSSDPGTLAVLDAADGPRVRVYHHSNEGVVAARSAAAAEARGDILVFLDPDDWFEPTYLEKALLTFARYPEVDILCPAVRVHSESADVPKYWLPAHFEERRLSYENSVPISSAMRRRVWEAVGGMPAEMSGGFEDWGFWRSAAAKGFQGWSLEDALLHYTHSHDTGRDAKARLIRDQLELTLKQLNPEVSHTPRPPAADIAALRAELASRVFHMPQTGRPYLVVFVPWMLEGGGAETFLLSALRALRDDFDIIVIGTNMVPPKHANAVNEFLTVTPYVYDLAPLVGPEAMLEMVQSLMYRLTEPNILLVGSPWAYANMPAIRRMGRGWGRLVDVQFNHLGHLPELLDIVPEVDQVLAAHQHLRSLLTDYFRIDAPVEVLYVAPAEHELPAAVRDRGRGDRLRIGWLGRNSPEKRADLVAAIAAAAPEADFVMAGSALEDLPPQPDNVEVVGWVDNALEFLNGLDLILNTSDVEGVSVTAMEALRLGVPVVTRDVGGMAELVRDGDNGLVYEESHLQGLADRLRDRGLIERLAANADRERLPEAFHFDTMVRTLRAALLGPGASHREEQQDADE